MTRERKNRDAGYTIMEVLVALVIISVAFYSVMVMITSGLAAKRSAQYESVAALLAQAKMEQLLRTGGGLTATAAAKGGAQGWTALNEAPQPIELPDDSLSKLDPRDRALFSAFRWQAAIKGLQEAEGLYELQLKITWLEGKREKAYKLVTLLSLGE